MSLLQAVEKQLREAEHAYNEASKQVVAGTLTSARYYRNVRDYWHNRYRKLMSDGPVAQTFNPQHRVIGGVTYQLQADGIGYEPVRAITTSTVTNRV